MACCCSCCLCMKLTQTGKNVSCICFIMPHEVCSTNPGNVTNGYFSCNPASLPGSSCTGTCLGSFSGTPTVTCLASGAWSNVQGSCTGEFFMTHVRINMLL
jgi:hypothetical protein